MPALTLTNDVNHCSPQRTQQCGGRSYERCRSEKEGTKESNIRVFGNTGDESGEPSEFLICMRRKRLLKVGCNCLPYVHFDQRLSGLLVRHLGMNTPWIKKNRYSSTFNKEMQNTAGGSAESRRRKSIPDVFCASLSSNLSWF